MRGRTAILAIMCVAAAAVPAGAQENRATVVDTAPIYLTPDAARTPLRLAEMNTDLKVLAEEGEWLRVEFRDAQFGPRVGYVEKRKVRVYRTPARDISAPEPESPSPPRAGAARQGPPPARSSAPGVQGYGTYGSTAFAAAQTFQAVTGSSRHASFGGGATVTRVWRGLFADAGLSQARIDGQRVFMDEGTVYSLGIPLQMKTRFIDAATGWRLTIGRVSPFLGAGWTWLQYHETGAFSDSGDDVNGRKSGALVLAGVDARVARWVSVGGEVRYRAVRGIFGQDGVSEAFGEDQIGGVSAGLRIAFGM